MVMHSSHLCDKGIDLYMEALEVVLLKIEELNEQRNRCSCVDFPHVEF